MSEERPKRKGQRSPYTRSVDTVLVEFTVQAMPADQDPHGERKGRPGRSPSLPPEEPKPDENPPPAT
jgi:hypothetical protein